MLARMTAYAFNELYKEIMYPISGPCAAKSDACSVCVSFAVTVQFDKACG